MAPKAPELKFQPEAAPNIHSDTDKKEGTPPDLETIPGGRSSHTSEDEHLAAERTRGIKLKIKSLENSSRKKSPEEQSDLDATRLDILSKQLPHARVLQDNLSAIRGLKTEIDSVLKSMQGIIAPGETQALSFGELLDAWANTPEDTLAPELSAKLTNELNELNIRYGQINAEYQEQQNMRLETETRLAELQDSLEEVEALKQEIVDDITSRIQVRKEGGSLIAKSSSSMFEQIGSYLHEYQSALNDEQQNLINELSKLEDSIPLLEAEAKSRGAGDWLKQLLKKSSERGYAKDHLADARARKRETSKNLERLVLIQRALGFASGHVGVTPAGLSNLESRLELTSGSGVIAPVPHKNAQQTFARTMMRDGKPIASESFEFGSVALMKEIQKKAAEQKNKKVKPLSDEEASYLRNLKTKKSPVTQEPAEPEIPAEDIHAEDSIPAIPVAEKPFVPVTTAHTETPAAEDLTPQRVKELRRQTTDVKADDILEMALKDINIYVKTASETTDAEQAGKINNYINLIISPKEAQAVAQELKTLFEEISADKKIPRSVMTAMRKRVNSAEQALLKRANETQAPAPSVEKPLDEEIDGSASVEAEAGTPISAATPLTVEHTTKPKEAAEAPLEAPAAREEEMSKLDVVMAELAKKIGPTVKAFNKGELTYDKALKQALSEVDITTGQISKDERKQLNEMFIGMIQDLKETRAEKGKEISPATEKLLRDIAKRIDPDWSEPKKPTTGRLKKWLVGLLSAAAIGGAVSEGVKQVVTKESGEMPKKTKGEDDNTPINVNVPKIDIRTSDIDQVALSAPLSVPETPAAQKGEIKESSSNAVTTLERDESVLPIAKPKTPAPRTRGATRADAARAAKPTSGIVGGADVDKTGVTATEPKGMGGELETPQHLIDMQIISDISKMGIAEQSLLRDAHIAFKRVFGLPRLVKAKGYSEAASAAQEEAIHTLEAAAKRVKNSQGASSLDRQRAEDIFTAIQYHAKEGLQ